MKRPYSCRQVTPVDACSHTNFYCVLATNGELRLRKDHVYYSKVQGQMGVTNESGDFVIYTVKGVSVERIRFDSDFWEKELVPKLTDFFDNCLAPKVASPAYVLGLHVRGLRIPDP